MRPICTRLRLSVPTAHMCPSVPASARMCPSVPECARLYPLVPACTHPLTALLFLLFDARSPMQLNAVLCNDEKCISSDVVKVHPCNDLGK